MPQPKLRHIAHLSTIIDAYDLIICDIWGVLHNGMSAFRFAHEALSAARARGVTVILLSNAPRPNDNILLQLDGLGIPREAYDAVVTSGDITRERIAAKQGAPFYMIGPDRDLPLIAGFDGARVPLESADYVLCTGLVDDNTDTPETYDPVLAIMKQRGLPMLCANPDLVVERGHELVYCAGAIAERYLSIGGEAMLIGKPHAIAYEAAFEKAQAVRALMPEKARTLGIGDAIRTDVAGARNVGIASFFVASGIHAGEILADTGIIDDAKLDDFLGRQSVRPDYVNEALVW